MRFTEILAWNKKAIERDTTNALISNLELIGGGIPDFTRVFGTTDNSQSTCQDIQNYSWDGIIEFNLVSVQRVTDILFQTYYDSSNVTSILPEVKISGTTSWVACNSMDLTAPPYGQNWAEAECPSRPIGSEIRLTITATSNYDICKIIPLSEPWNSCQDATISPQTVTLPSVEYNKASESYPYSMAGFKDSLESTLQGTCGTKKVTLDPTNSSTAFLALSSDTDPLTFEYVMAMITFGDIGVHTVNYTVDITDYKDYTAAITGSATFVIERETSTKITE